MKPVRFALVGAGGFAFFAVSEFAKMTDVRFVGVYDSVSDNCSKFKGIEKDIVIYASLDELVADETVDLVYIATPPDLHYAQSRSALLAGKHVVCEKPAAIQLAHAVELKKIAREKGLLFVVNLMQRYNFFFDAVKEIVTQEVLGKFLHGYFENYASDEFLKEGHWFWDEVKSGGIFIEHGVHFFDLFSGWLGEGKVVAAQKMNRPGFPDIWDKAQATVLYAGGLVNFYHGFDQPKAMDRQEMRLQFERGDITLFEWVPTRLKIHALCSNEQLEFLRNLFPTAEVDISKTGTESNKAMGRFKEIEYQHHMHLDTGDKIGKQSLYQDLVRKMFADQIGWILDPTSFRKITDDNAVTSLYLAESAETIAQRIY